MCILVCVGASDWVGTGSLGEAAALLHLERSSRLFQPDFPQTIALQDSYGEMVKG